VKVTGECPGVVLEDLQLYPEADLHGLIVARVKLKADQRPVLVQGCFIKEGDVGLFVGGPLKVEDEHGPTSGVVFRGNRVAGAGRGILVEGFVSRTQVTGNVVWGCKHGGVQVQDLVTGSEKLLLANNTVFDCRGGLCFLDTLGPDDSAQTRVEVRNNLVFDCPYGDLLCFRRTGIGKPALASPPLAQALLQQWHFADNVRDGASLNGLGILMPLAEGDRKLAQITLLSREPRQADFGRPARALLVADSAAGKNDPSLPAYVGAVPPEGAQTWDWSRTWQAPPPGHLVTVSQKPSGGGTYRTINGALADAKPWTTIRVLDGGTYPESIVLDDPKKYEGVVLEAPKGATILLGNLAQRALTINGVPNVRVKGFRFRAPPARLRFSYLTVLGPSHGIVLEGLDLQAAMPHYGILLKEVWAAGATPLVVRKCTFKGSIGVHVRGPLQGEKGATPAGGISVQENRFVGGLQGVAIQGAAVRVQVVGNTLSGYSQTCLSVEDPESTSGQILFANNTAFESNFLFRVWHNQPTGKVGPRQVELSNNLFFDALDADLTVAVQKGNEGSSDRERAATLATAWRFWRNWRDLSGIRAPFACPLAPEDRRLSSPKLLSRKPSDPDFLRPAPDEPWANDGAGQRDPSLPAYVGAVPPAGVPPWDWERTWWARAGKK
jgi:hypothetical protein